MIHLRALAMKMAARKMKRAAMAAMAAILNHIPQRRVLIL
jgi:hypothetical protein